MDTPVHGGTSIGIGRRELLANLGKVGAGTVAARIGVLGLATATGLARPTDALASGKGIGAGADRHGPEVLQDWYDTLYRGCMDDPAMTPGRAARIYGTCAVAAYEAVVAGSSNLASLAGQLGGLEPMPPTTKSSAVDWPLAASAAVATTAADLLRAGPAGVQDSVAAQLATHTEQRRSAGVPREIIDRSLQHGRTIGGHVAAWVRGDGAEQTFSLAYTPPVGPSLWRSTAPNFGKAIDPYWGRVRPMALPTADACAPVPPVEFSTAEGSAFHQQAMAVLEVADRITDADRATSLFWRDNPTTSGLPSGHWMRLVAQLCGERGLTLAGTAEVLALTGITLHDAFISCWHQKYEVNLLRPISYIRAHVPGREEWLSYVNTPQFPEYTSGHSVASQAAATVLARAMGTFAFTDRTHGLRNPQLGSRSYASFQAAADEAAGSRLQGGIHYPMGIEVGMDQGEQVGNTVLARVRTRRA